MTPKNTARQAPVAEPEKMESLLMDAIESIEGGAVLFDADDRFVLCNSTYRENLGKNSGRVFGDPAQIQTVIMNLAANAVDAMEGKTGDLTISLSQAFVDDSPANSVPGLDRGNYAKLTVSDQGQGMDEDTLNQIFDPFFTTKEPDKGAAGQGPALFSSFLSVF